MATAQAHRADRSAVQVEEAAKQLRDAVLRREYEGIEARIVVYCDAARDRLNTLKGEDLKNGDERGRAALNQALDLLEWTRLMLCVGRAACAGRLKRAAFAGRFLDPQAFRVPAIRFDL
jgi:hypothetical protein